MNRKRELYGEDMEPKKWANNEIAFVQLKIEEADKMLDESRKIFHDVEHVSNQVIKRLIHTLCMKMRKSINRKEPRNRGQREKRKDKLWQCQN